MGDKLGYNETAHSGRRAASFARRGECEPGSASPLLKMKALNPTSRSDSITRTVTHASRGYYTVEDWRYGARTHQRTRSASCAKSLTSDTNANPASSSERDWWGDSLHGEVTVAELMARDEYHLERSGALRVACPNCQDDPVTLRPYERALLIDPTYGRCASEDRAPWRCQACGMHRVGFEEATQRRDEFKAAIARLDQAKAEVWNDLDRFERACISVARNTMVERGHTNDVPLSARYLVREVEKYHRLTMSPMTALKAMTRAAEKLGLKRSHDGTPLGHGIGDAARFSYMPAATSNALVVPTNISAVDKESEEIACSNASDASFEGSTSGNTPLMTHLRNARLYRSPSEHAAERSRGEMQLLRDGLVRHNLAVEGVARLRGDETGVRDEHEAETGPPLLLTPDENMARLQALLAADHERRHAVRAGAPHS